MPRPILKTSDKNDAVKELQDVLNRIGALLIDDGDFGPGTAAAVREAQASAGLDISGVADERTWNWLESQPLPSPHLCTGDVTFVVREEVGDRRRYEQAAAAPHMPGVASGVTIGIGYDLRFKGASDLLADWQDELSQEVIDRLRPCLGRLGSASDAALLKSIHVPFASAWRVFTRRTLPRYIAMTRTAYPSFPLLPDGCRGALVSLVYNRGAGMDGDSRREMKNIAACMQNSQLDRVPAEIEAMRRLWPDAPGLCERRRREADLWRRGLDAA